MSVIHVRNIRDREAGTECSACGSSKEKRFNERGAIWGRSWRSLETYVFLLVHIISVKPLNLQVCLQVPPFIVITSVFNWVFAFHLDLTEMYTTVTDSWLPLGTLKFSSSGTPINIIYVHQDIFEFFKILCTSLCLLAVL